MSLLRTNMVTVGSVLAFTGVEAEVGQTFLHGKSTEFNLDRGDVVKVIDIDRKRKADTPYTRVTVACLKGKFCGRVGVVSMDLSTRYQRSWQRLTQTGSMAPVRASNLKTPPSGYRIVNGKPVVQDEVRREGNSNNKQTKL
jgi:hypothetical protein